MKKVILTEILFLRKKKKKLYEKKKRGCTFIKINTSKEGYDADYEASRIQTFSSIFKDRKLRKLEKNRTKG